MKRRIFITSEIGKKTEFEVYCDCINSKKDLLKMADKAADAIFNTKEGK